MDDTAARCRSCGADAPPVVLSLGKTPIADVLLTADELDRPEATFPLAVRLLEVPESGNPRSLTEGYLSAQHREGLTRPIVVTPGHPTRPLAITARWCQTMPRRAAW